MVDTTQLDPPSADGRREPRASPFYVPAFLDALGGLVHRNRALWLWLGGLESKLLADSLYAMPIRMPIFIAGLARSGSSLLHELVASHAGVATHRSKDYPMLFTPYWWRRATVTMRPSPPHERPHRDGVMITTESPDALEEMLWMAFFPRCHDPAFTSVLTAEEHHPAFESFYRLHIRKLLLAEGATRYAAKANYHVARLCYLLRLFPDARFVIPVRHPVDHIASLLRQHRWFSAGQRQHPRALRYMQRTGHFEFGLDRRPIHLGDREQVDRIRAAWAAGDEVRGLAITWAMVYGFLGRLLTASAELRQATIGARYEAICTDPASALRSVLRHCALADADKLAERHASVIRRIIPGNHEFSSRDLDVIREETAAVAGRWEY
jgi:Sulfotransferase family